MKISKIFPPILYLFLLAIIYGAVFSSAAISGGDYTPASPTTQLLLANFSGWCNYSNLGVNCIAFNLHYVPIWLIARFLTESFHFQTNIVERLIWWLPFFILGTFSPVFLFRKVFPNAKFSLLAPLIFLFNSYILMVIGGGQIAGIGLAYAFSPIVILTCIFLLQNKTVKNSLIFGLVLAISVVLDLRMAYIYVAGIVLLLVFKLITIRSKTIVIFSFLKSAFLLIILPALTTALLHIFWLIPLAIVRQNPLQQLGAAYDSVSAVKFFSFATFEQTLGLLHPNWPENIFGKVGFMRTEFLILPIFAFLSLFFLKKPKNEIGKKENFFVLYFTLLGLLGIFLAKGAQDPFGGIYLWMFNHVPGFIMFRDPTKWYVLIAISYSMLIPFAIFNLGVLINEKQNIKNEKKGFYLKRYISYIPLLFFIFVFLTLQRQALLGQLTGTFQKHSKPIEYVDLEKYLVSDNNFGRTLWVPSSSRFGYYSMQHPELSAQDLFKASNLNSLMNILNKQNTQIILKEESVKYIIVPYDSLGEIFLKDRKYDNSLYLRAIYGLRKISWLKQDTGFGKIAVFEIPEAKDHFWIANNPSVSVSYQELSPYSYSLYVRNAKKWNKLIFSESYDKNWQLKVGKLRLSSKPFDNSLNSFSLPKDGNYSVNVYYAPQDWVNEGLWLSSFTTLVIIFFFAKISRNKTLHNGY